MTDPDPLMTDQLMTDQLMTDQLMTDQLMTDSLKLRTQLQVNKDPFGNIPPSILSKIGCNLHLLPNHPIQLMKNDIYAYFNTIGNYIKHDTLSPVVSTIDNFDNLLVPVNHPSRSKSDTYYVDEHRILRSHMTAHDFQHLLNGERNFLSTGDVYRKDEVDQTHYPVFHQMDGVGVVPPGEDPSKVLLTILSGLVKWLFPGQEYRINDDYFPFTSPSYEIEVLHNGKWLEILGGGILHPQILENAKCSEQLWAFGVGLERLCMICFEIPDIRYFWSEHPRFLDQFYLSPQDDCLHSRITSIKDIKFKMYSELPNLRKDISFWIPESQLKFENDGSKCSTSWIQENDFYEIVRDNGGEYVESIILMDVFFHQKKKKYSRTYTVLYSPSNPTLNDPGEFTKMINEIHHSLGIDIEKKLNVSIR
jgi:phenylalanyl-tRNA synthetase alpha chain